LPAGYVHRRCGPCDAGVQTPTSKWDEGILLVRRSHTLSDEVMERTKTGKNQTIYLPIELVEILRWHVEYHIDDGIKSQT
jgi:hypothetical protein